MIGILTCSATIRFHYHNISTIVKKSGLTASILTIASTSKYRRVVSFVLWKMGFFFAGNSLVFHVVRLSRQQSQVLWLLGLLIDDYQIEVNRNNCSSNLFCIKKSRIAGRDTFPMLSTTMISNSRESLSSNEAHIICRVFIMFFL